MSRKRSTRLSAVLAALIILQSCNTALAIKCFKTAVGSTPHVVECGPLARACRVIVKPYKVQNNSAVTDCTDSQNLGRFVFDCAVECAARKEDWHWNEVECCNGDMCNTGEELRKYAKCYVSKGEGSEVNDRIEICGRRYRCGINVNTKETRCAKEEECNSPEWTCCFGHNCYNKWGVEKVPIEVTEEESTDAHSLKSSAALTVTVSAIAVLTYR